MSEKYRATDKDWELVEGWAPDDTDVRCLLELRSRVELLELRCEVQLQQLSDLQDRHHRLAGSVRLLERDVVVDQPEPAPLATDQDLYQLYDLTGPTVADAFRAIYDLGRQHGADQVAPVQSLMERVEALASGDAPVFDPRTNVTGKGVTVEGSFDQDGTTYVFKTSAQPAPAALAENVSVLDAKAWAYIGRQAILGDPDAQSLVDLLSDAPAAQPEPPTFQESQASKAHYEAESARLKCEAMQQPAKPAPDAPSVKDSLTDAPAGSLMERLAWIIEPGDPLVWSGTCGLILLEVAAWLRENDSEREMGGDAAATADLIEQEASR
jgi:hypothetical protein